MTDARRVLPLLLAFGPLLGCAGTGPAPAARAEARAAATAETAKPEAAAKDTPSATAGGATFTVPTSWTLLGDPAHRVIEGPEKDVRVAIVDVAAPSAEEAVKRAWPVLDPKFARPVRIAQDRPARFGWDARRVIVYETSPNEKRGVYAVAHRHGATWTVALVDGADAAQEKRAAQIRLTLDSLRPAGYVKESFAGKTAHPLDAARVKLLTDYVEKARKASGTPGVAIALVEKGRLVFSGGFGVKELGRPDPVGPDTLFIIASNTKALTTLLLAKEVDAGKFRWDSRVVDVDPTFRLGDDAVRRSVLFKHLICACTGMPRQDLEWIFEFKDATPASEMALLGTFMPTSKFGEVFQYSNLMASAAGFIGGRVLHPDMELGAGYDLAMAKEVFEPLGMRTTTFDFAKALAGDHASAHGEDVDGKPALGAMEVNSAVVPLRPAGGAWSSANELVKYVAMELADGKLPDGSRLVSEANLLARREPQVIIGEDKTYGMGLMVDRTWGVPVVHHGGDLVGYHSDMFWIPDAGVGGVILTNSDPGVYLRGPLVRRLLEVLYDGRPEAEEDALSAIARHQETMRVERKRLVVPADPAVAAGLARRYANASLGEVAIATRGGETIVDAGEWKSAAATRKNDDGTVSLITIRPGIEGVEFVVGSAGGRRTLTVRDAQHEYVFTER